MINPIISRHLEEIKDTCNKHHVKYLFLIGSAARITNNR
ncbi:putative nucleotidyltransferase [Chitinophaga sp. W3I9]